MVAYSAPTKGKFNRRDVALAAAFFLAVVGLALGTLKILHDRSPSGAVALSDVGKFLFVPSRDIAEVTVIDSKSDRVVTRLALAGVPRQVLVSEAAGAMVASFPDRSVLEAIDLSSPAEKAKIDLTMVPEFMVLSPDGYLLAAADGETAGSEAGGLPGSEWTRGGARSRPPDHPGQPRSSRRPDEPRRRDGDRPEPSGSTSDSAREHR